MRGKQSASRSAGSHVFDRYRSISDKVGARILSSQHHDFGRKPSRNSAVGGHCVLLNGGDPRLRLQPDGTRKACSRNRVSRCVRQAASGLPAPE